MGCDLWLHFGPLYTQGHLETPGSQTTVNNVPMLRTCILGAGAALRDKVCMACFVMALVAPRWAGDTRDSHFSLLL